MVREEMLSFFLLFPFKLGTVGEWRNGAIGEVGALQTRGAGALPPLEFLHLSWLALFRLCWSETGTSLQHRPEVGHSPLPGSPRVKAKGCRGTTGLGKTGAGIRGQGSEPNPSTLCHVLVISILQLRGNMRG